jgi:alpha-L-fucosidase
VAGDPNWSTVDPASVPYPGAEGEAVIQSLLHGDPSGSAWRPGETDTSIRPGWFYHPAEDGQVRTVDQLVGLYFTSVGRNSKLLLNVPPTREGVLYPTDVERLLGMRRALDGLFATDLAAGVTPAWHQTGERTAEAELELGGAVPVGIVSLGEATENGQIVASYRIDGMVGGEWRPLSAGTTIGYRKLDRCEPLEVSGVRISIEVVEGPPRPIGISLFGGG